MNDEQLARHFTILGRLAWLALAGAIGLAVIFFSNSTFHDSHAVVTLGNWVIAATLLCAFSLVPLVIYATLVCIWHWKARYKGRHSKLWGALLVFEVTGWFKLVYLFRHFIADARRKGRYA